MTIVTEIHEDEETETGADEVTETGADEVTTQLRVACRRVDEAEAELEDSRSQLAEAVQAAVSTGMRVPLIEALTGYSRGYVYELLGPEKVPRTRLRRQIREERRGKLARWLTLQTEMDEVRAERRREGL